MDHYVEWMRLRTTQLHRVLKPAGSLYLHCDPAASHYLKVMLDKIFGGENFRNEIIWKRTTAHSSAKKFAPVHDTILCYGKTRTVTWNGARLPYEDAYLAKYYKFDDGDGRLYWRADICAAGVRKGSSGLPWRGFDPAAKGMHWKFTTPRLDELDAEGRIYWPKGGTGWPQYKRYRDELKGRAVSDIWDDVDRINPKGNERVGYPTQKPEALLERIIEASSNPGDIVLDPFCGCGTTISVASRLNRKWVGIDISPTAMRVVRRRLNRARIYDFRIDNLPETEADLKQLQHFEFQNWIIDVLHGTHAPRKSGDMGIDGYSFFERLPIQVKQVEKVGRETVDKFETAIRRDGKDKGYIVAFSFGRGAYTEVARAKTEGLEIALVTVATLLNNPDDKPLDPNLDDLTTELLNKAREAAARYVPQQAPPRTAEELIASSGG